MKKLCMMLLAIVGFAMSANAITLTVVSGDKNDPGNNEGCQKLVDGNYGTKWGDGISEGQTKYVIVKSNVAIIPASYVLVTGNDTGGSNSGRNWNNWKVYAGNFASDADAARNAEGWVLIDQRTNVGGTDQLPAANSQATPPFVLTETVTAPYLYFKIEIESCVDLNTYMQMGEFFFDKYTVDLSAFAEDIAAANSFEYKKAGDALLEAEYEALLKKLNASEDADEVDATLTQLTNVKNFINSQAEKEFLALSGSNTWGDGGWANFVDGNYDTKWGGGLGSEGMWIVFRVKGGVQPYVYRLVTGGDTKKWSDRNWSTWTVYGANFTSVSEVSENSDQWVPLDVRENIGQDLFPAENRNPTTFTFTEGVNEPYYYYKVHVTKSYNNGSNQQMSEIEFLTKAQLDEQKQAYIDEYASVDLEAEVEPWHQAEKATFIETLNQLKETNDVLEMSKLNNTLAGLKSTLEASIEDRAAQQERYGKGGFLPLAGNTAWGNGENWTRLIDENHDSKWGGGRPENGSFLIFKTAEGIAPKFYTLMTGNDTKAYPNRNWTTWKIYGANFATDADATREADWTLIDSKDAIGQDKLPAEDFAPAYFSFSENIAQAFQYFKIEIEAAFDNGGSIQMTEFDFMTAEQVEAAKAAYVEVLAPFINAVYADDAMKLKYNAALREISIAAPEGILAAVAAAQAVQNEILAAQPELAVVDGAYQIGNAGDLMTFAKMVISSSVDGEGKVSYPFATANATLTADINLASVNFNPIGSNDIKYGGTFDGQGHAIKNMNIDQPSTAFRGLFSVVENATIKQVKIMDAYVAGNENVGAVVGRAINSNIEGNAVLNSYIEGRDHAGAVAGEIRGNAGTHFADNYSDSEVYSREYQAGGMIGTILGGTVEHNLFIGTVDAGGGRSGGLIALLDGNESDVVIKNNAIFPATVDAGWGAESCYAIMMRAGRNASYENNYSLSTALYNGETFGLTNPNDENGGQVDWATSTSRAFYRDVLGFDFAQKWTMAYGGTYPTPSYITYDGPTKAKVPVTAAGYATFVAPADVDFSQVEGVQAFYVTDGGSAHKKLEPTTLVRHGEAVVVTAKVEESGETFETGSSVEGTVLTLTNGDVKPGTKTVTITTADMGLGNSEKVEGEWEFNDFTMTLSKGEGSTVPAYYTSGTAIRLYANNTVTFTGKELPIAKVVIECGNASYTGKGWAVTADDNSLELLHVATSGHIRMQTITITFADEGITVPYTAQDIAEPNADNELIAAFDDVDADGSEYVLAQKNGVVAFYQVEAGTTIPAGKGYLKTQTPGVKVYYLGTDDETGIEMAQELKGTDVQGDAAIFDLSGRRVEKLQKGIYIMNGKKVLK